MLMDNEHFLAHNIILNYIKLYTVMKRFRQTLNVFIRRRLDLAGTRDLFGVKCSFFDISLLCNVYKIKSYFFDFFSGTPRP